MFPGAQQRVLLVVALHALEEGDIVGVNRLQVRLKKMSRECVADCDFVFPLIIMIYLQKVFVRKGFATHCAVRVQIVVHVRQVKL